MEVTENSKGVTKVSELYFKNNYLSLVIEKEINTLDSITENHFYFKNNKLIKKVTNLQYEKTSFNEDLIIEEKRVKNKCDNYAAQMMTEIKKTFENNN